MLSNISQCSRNCRIWQALIFLLVALSFCSCVPTSSSQKQLDYAESLLTDNPEGALEVLDNISSDLLPSLERSQYIYIKTRAFIKMEQEVTWQEDMHKAAVCYEKNARPYDGIKAGDYFYFSGLAYKRSGQEPTAVVEWLKAAEILEKEKPVLRLFSTYANLYNSYYAQFMEEECIDYASKLYATAIALNDSARILRVASELANLVVMTWPVDSTYSLLQNQLKIAKELKDTTEIVYAYTDIAFLYFKHDEIEKASAFVDSANNVKIIKGQRKTEGRIRMKQGRYAEAVELLLEAYQDAVDFSSKYWIGQSLYEISRTQPGYEYLSCYADSLIYYNQKYDQEEKSDEINQAIAQYRVQRKEEEYHQMRKSIGIAAVIVALIFGLSYGWKTWCTNQHIKHLQQLLQEEKAKMLVDEDIADPNERIAQRRNSLKLHFDIFATTETYRDLLLLYNLQPGQMVNAQKRESLVSHTLGGFYDVIRPMLDAGQYSQEEVFLCLMTYMKFRSREIAACLGVSDDAIRQRKRRIRSRLEGSDFDIFFDSRVS